jgi:hypothetical protein
MIRICSREPHILVEQYLVEVRNLATEMTEHCFPAAGHKAEDDYFEQRTRVLHSKVLLAETLLEGTLSTLLSAGPWHLGQEKQHCMELLHSLYSICAFTFKFTGRTLMLL